MEDVDYSPENKECTHTFDSEMESLDFTEGDDFGRVEYEVLAERKRKSHCSPLSDGTAKRARVEDALFENIDEVTQNMSSKSRQPKKRGRRKGAKANLRPEVSRKLGEANIYYAKGQYDDAVRVLKEVVMLAPNLSETYHTLGLVYEEIGDKKKCVNFYMLAVQLAPQDHPFLWKRLYVMSMEQGNTGQATYCLDKAIKADPDDTNLIVNRAALYVELNDYCKAAELYQQIVGLCPDNVEARIMAAKMYHKSNQIEQSVGVLEDYIKSHSSNDDFRVINLLVAIHMENKAYGKAIQQIELSRLACSSQKQFPVNLTVKAGICQVHLGNMKEAQVHFNYLQAECIEDVADLIREVAEACVNNGQYELALMYYFKLEGNATHGNGFLHLRIAKCYISLMEREKAIAYFYKALLMMEDNIDVRITLASLLLEEGKIDEAITLLSPPKHIEPPVNGCYVQSRVWWDSGEVKKYLAQIYYSKGMVKEFVDAIFHPIIETLNFEYSNQKFKPGQRLSNSTLAQRVKVLEDNQDDYILCGFKPLAAPSELVKAAKARKELRRREAIKEERRAAVLAAGLEWQSDDSDEEATWTQREPPFPNLLKDNKYYQLILDLCKALASLGRYWEALKIIKDFLDLASNVLSSQKKEELKTLETLVAYNTDSPTSCTEAQATVQRHPKSIAAWNNYYRVKAESRSQNASRFLRLMMHTDPECVPPIIISGHQFTIINQHQEAARKYLEAFKLQPDSPLINLCVGTALINLALGFRVQNKHQCLAQGFAFLYNNLRLCQNNQEALYNIARAYQHVGLVTLAASYYEKVLETPEEDYPIPKFPFEDQSPGKSQKPCYCDVRKEAAYNLHLIYKTSGAIDLAREVLRSHCTP